MAAAATTPFIPTFDKTTSEAARAGAASYLASRLKPSAPADAPFTIPTIDISPSFSANIEDRKTVAAQIRAACITSGFFTITNHGIPTEVCDGILDQAKRFFHDLPREKKETIHMKQSTLHRGYEPPEYTSAVGEAETKEGFNWGYETRLDSTGGDGKYVEVDGTIYPGGANLWPSEADLPGFFEGVKAYYGQVLGLARHMFRLFALSLGLEEDYFDEMMTHPGGIARLMHYPGAKDPKPLDPNERAKKNLGLGAHSDYECFTLLLPSSTPGLEVLSPTGHWIPINKVPGGLIVNVADFLMHWTNDLYKSTVHRVVNRTTDARYSVPFFFSINYDQKVETLPSCTSESNPSKYAPIKAGEYILERLNATTKDGAGSYGNSNLDA